QGIGIIEGEEARIWDLLYRGSNVETRRGLGLGLFIACQLVQVLGGDISADSAGADQGACFTVRYPLPVIKQS
ncbi:MAG: sensor histidine kinase, partial [Candidatus Promineifilaceae bacterium]